MSDTVVERVERGATWLDLVYPEWWTKIDVGTLYLASPCRCVLGQVVGDTERFVRYACGCSCCVKATDSGFRAVERVTGTDWLLHYGFTTADRGWRALDEAWIAEIKRRWERGL